MVGNDMSWNQMTSRIVLGFVCCFVVLWSCLAGGQARTLSTHTGNPVQLSSTDGRSVVLATVLLGQPRKFSMFKIQAAGTITPDPASNGAEFELQFLVCDQFDCRGETRMPIRVLTREDEGEGTQIIATRAFSVTTHSGGTLDLTKLLPPNGGELYLALSLRTVESSDTVPFTARVSLLRVDVMP